MCHTCVCEGYKCDQYACTMYHFPLNVCELSSKLLKKTYCTGTLPYVCICAVCQLQYLLSGSLVLHVCNSIHIYATASLLKFNLCIRKCIHESLSCMCTNLVPIHVHGLVQCVVHIVVWGVFYFGQQNSSPFMATNAVHDQLYVLILLLQ